MDDQRDGERNEGEGGETRKRKQRKHGLDGDAPDPDGLEGHPGKIDRFAGLLDQNRNIASAPLVIERLYLLRARLAR
jgi:hypothetical protein